MTTSPVTEGIVPLDMLTALQALGLEKVREVGGEVWALCPSRDHDDSKPTNFSVNKATGRYNCFACGFGSQVFADLVVYLRRCDGWEANRWIRKHGVSLQALDDLITDVSQLEDDEREAVERGERLQMTESRLTVFGPPPGKQIRRRGLTREAVEFYGVLWDADKRAWILPIRSPEDGKLLGWQIKGREIFRNYPLGVEKSKCLFGLEQFKEGEKAIVVESPLDVPRLYVAGVTGGLATYGSAVSDEQMRLILERTDEVVIATDNPTQDSAGLKAAQRLKRDWARRFYMEFFSYKHTEANDPGEMTDEEIHVGLEYAEHSATVHL